MKEPAGVAVNDTSHDVYVLDRGGERVVQFDSSGAFVSEFTGAATPAGSFSSPNFVAVDNSGNPLDPSWGDVYVLDAGHDAIDKFDASGTYLGQIVESAEGSPFGELDGVDVDSAGRLWVYQASGEIDDFSDALVNEFITTRGSPFGTSAGFAVDGEGHLYVNRGAQVIAKLEENGTPLVEELDSESTTAASVDLSNENVYVDNLESIARFDTSASLVERFGSGHLAGSSGVAVDAGSGTVYASRASGEVVEFGAVVVPDATTTEAAPGETSATLNGLVNPDGLEVTSCEFEYGTSTGYGTSVPCSQTSAEIGTGSSPVPVSATVAGLEPRQTYHFRLTVANVNGTSHGLDETFITPSKPIVEDESVIDVNASDATVGANVTPGGRHTTYSVEYGTSTSYGKAAPGPSASAGAGLTAVAVSAQLQPLEPAATYHFRVQATNGLGSVYGPDETFTTPPLAAPLSLPDGRAWEMVSPPDKHGGLVAPFLLEGMDEAAAGGDAFTFLSEQSLFGEAHGSPIFAQVLARRSPTAWVAEDIATPHDSPSGQGVGQGQEYRLFSPDLTRAVVEPFGPFTPLSPDATQRTPYVRDSRTGSFTPLLTPSDVTTGAQFGGDPARPTGPVKAFAATPDFAHVVVKAEGAVPLGSPATNGGLYEWSSGTLQLLSVLPDKTAIPGELGFNGKEMRNAISTDGSRVFWEGEANLGGFSGRHLFLRQSVKGETLEIDKPAAGASGAGEPAPVFQDATPDGSKVFFTDEQALTEGATAGINSPDLYECEVLEKAGELTCDLTDLTVPGAGEAAEVQGFVLGVSDDGSYVYVVAHGVLSDPSEQNEHGESAAEGANNLYVLHDVGGNWTPKFIAALSEEEKFEWISLERMAARVSPNGRYFAFMSQRSLTGYDNTDARSGASDDEVFLYDASGSPHLRCPSCRPTGARPVGTREVGTALNLVDHFNAWSEHTLAATVPTSEQLENASDPVYQPRYLSNEGRLFFNSADKLVPQDGNNQWDVYEFEPAPVGSCTTAAESYSARSSGCVSLISSARSSQESAFLDASEGGGDVFFITSAKLASQDVDEQRDIYDAHECGLSPCISSAEAGSPAPCTSAQSCRTLQPTEGLGSPPATETLTGDGNLPDSASSPAKSKPPTRAQLLARALKACRRKPKRARARCRALAERRYGTHRTVKRGHKSQTHVSTKRGGGSR